MRRAILSFPSTLQVPVKPPLPHPSSSGTEDSTWVTSGNQLHLKVAKVLLQACCNDDVNFFHSARAWRHDRGNDGSTQRVAGAWAHDVRRFSTMATTPRHDGSGG
jgi:hypothetical protein